MSRLDRHGYADSPISHWPALLRLLGRHQLGALVTTAVDFGVMIAVVQALHARPVAGTVAGAMTGALTNFLLGRYWIFDPRDTRSGKARHQALRYAFASAASLGLNALGVRLLAELGGIQYIVARTIVAGCVSVFWNFPMHRNFVFQARPGSEPGDALHARGAVSLSPEEGKGPRVTMSPSSRS